MAREEQMGKPTKLILNIVKKMRTFYTTTYILINTTLSQDVPTFHESQVLLHTVI